MRARWRWLQEDPNLGKALAIMGIAFLGFAAWAVFHDNGPDLDGNFVDDTALGPCLQDAERPMSGWKLSYGDRNDTAAVPQWTMSWASERGLRDSATLFVMPTAVGAHKLDLAYGASSPANPRELESFENILYEHSDGDEGATVPDGVRTLVYQCLESAATEPPHGAEGGFSDCEAPAGVEIAVRGESCEQGKALLATANGARKCGGNGEGFVCARVSGCCGNSVSYIGDGQTEIVIRSSI